MRCYCDNCGWEGDAHDTKLISDVFRRVDAGEIMPAGECHECGALVHLCNADIPENTLLYCIQVARERGFLIKEVATKGV